MLLLDTNKKTVTQYFISCCETQIAELKNKADDSKATAQPYREQIAACEKFKAMMFEKLPGYISRKQLEEKAKDEAARLAQHAACVKALQNLPRFTLKKPTHKIKP